MHGRQLTLGNFILDRLAEDIANKGDELAVRAERDRAIYIACTDTMQEEQGGLRSAGVRVLPAGRPAASRSGSLMPVTSMLPGVGGASWSC